MGDNPAFNHTRSVYNESLKCEFCLAGEAFLNWWLGRLNQLSGVLADAKRDNDLLALGVYGTELYRLRDDDSHSKRYALDAYQRMLESNPQLAQKLIRDGFLAWERGRQWGLCQ